MYARTVIKYNQHSKSADYEVACLKACPMARSKETFSAKCPIREIFDKRAQADLPTVWKEEGKEEDYQKSYMSV